MVLILFRYWSLVGIARFCVQYHSISGWWLEVAKAERPSSESPRVNSSPHFSRLVFALVNKYARRGERAFRRVAETRRNYASRARLAKQRAIWLELTHPVLLNDGGYREAGGPDQRTDLAQVPFVAWLPSPFKLPPRA